MAEIAADRRRRRERESKGRGVACRRDDRPADLGADEDEESVGLVASLPSLEHGRRHLVRHGRFD